jgi:hypothetical protein
MIVLLGFEEYTLQIKKNQCDLNEKVFPQILSGNGSDNDWQVMQESAMFAGLAISQNHTAIAHAIYSLVCDSSNRVERIRA